jgi:hypothetical protein
MICLSFIASGVSNVGIGPTVIRIGTRAIENRIDTKIKRLAPAGSPMPSNIGPDPNPPRVTTMYAESSLPRVALLILSFSQLSATVKRPAKQLPVTKRINIHAIGER